MKEAMPSIPNLKNSTWLDFSKIVGQLNKSTVIESRSASRTVRQYTSVKKNKTKQKTDQWLSGVEGKGRVEKIIKKQEEIFGFGTSVQYYCNCGDGFTTVVMYQNISNCTF